MNKYTYPQKTHRLINNIVTVSDLYSLLLPILSLILLLAFSQQIIIRRMPKASPVTQLKNPFVWIFLLLMTFLAAAGIVYAVSLKADVARLKSDNDKLVTLISDQHKLTQQQLTIVTKQLDLSSSLLDISKQQLEATKGVVQLNDVTNSQLRASLSLQAQLLGIAQDTLQQARAINSKMPPPTPVGGLSL